MLRYAQKRRSWRAALRNQQKFAQARGAVASVCVTCRASRICCWGRPPTTACAATLRHARPRAPAARRTPNVVSCCGVCEMRAKNGVSEAGVRKRSLRARMMLPPRCRRGLQTTSNGNRPGVVRWWALGEGGSAEGERHMRADSAQTLVVHPQQAVVVAKAREVHNTPQARTCNRVETQTRGIAEAGVAHAAMPAGQPRRFERPQMQRGVIPARRMQWHVQLVVNAAQQTNVGAPAAAVLAWRGARCAQSV